MIYLLQLVQALKFEHVHYTDTGSTIIMEDNPSHSPLVRLLVERAIKNEEFGSLLFWYLRVEKLDSVHGRWFEAINAHLLQELEIKVILFLKRTSFISPW